MLLQQSSSTLGYPGEISQPLNANHHEVCKFSSREDPNYQSVCSVLRELVKQYKDIGLCSVTPCVVALYLTVSHSVFNINNEISFENAKDRKSTWGFKCAGKDLYCLIRQTQGGDLPEHPFQSYLRGLGTPFNTFEYTLVVCAPWIGEVGPKFLSD